MNAAADARIENIGWAILTVLFIIATSFVLAQLARLVARLFRQSEAEQRRIFWGFLFAGPWIVGFIIFVLGPTIASLYYSFTDYKLGDVPEWVGLENYRTLLLGEGAHGRRFFQAMYNSFYYAIVGVPLQISAALGMALLLNQKIRGVKIFRLVFYLPVILAGGPAILLAWRYMLSSNGGFINVTLQGLSESFFLFDWLHRGFIFLVEGFNGFYTGIARGDPIGPLSFVLPGFIGMLLLVTLLGDWTPSKRERAVRAAEILILIIVGALAANGLVAEQVDVSWTLVWGIISLLSVLSNARSGKILMMRVWQWGGLGLLGTGLILSIVQAQPESPLTLGYVLACALTIAPLIVSLFGKWERRKYQLLGAAAALIALVLFVRTVPGQLDGGRLTLIPRYLTMQSAIENPTDQAYLEDVFPNQTMSALWLYGAVAATAVVVAVLDKRQTAARTWIIRGALVFFTLFTLGALWDTMRYFGAFEAIAASSGATNYHFSLFHQATSEFPDQNRVALWMTSELWSKPSLILITVWSAGSGMLIFLAALQGVPRVLYESAEVDGANRLQKFFSITFPFITPALFYNLIIGIIAALQTFDTIYILQTPQNVDSLRSAAFFLYERTFRQLEIGQGAAASWILVVLIVVLTTLQFRYSNWVNYEA
ncbi:MAG: sugar ABC transporter permease [Anaerolineae bacterium]